MEHTIWVEKYRPRSMDDYVADADLKQKMQGFIRDNDIPHLLFHSRPGTGKSALAKILVEQIDCEHLYINASNERGIDTVRDTVLNFAHAAVHDLKIIILDEFDNFTQDAQKALRDPMVEYADHTRFILTANHPEDIHPAIKSRSQEVEIEPHSKKEAWKVLVRILEQEGVEYEPEDAQKIAREYYPDLRKIINAAQNLTVGGRLKYDENRLMDSNFGDKVIELVNRASSVQQGYKAVRKLVQNEGIQKFGQVYRHLYDNLGEFASDAEQPEIILVIANAQQRSQSAPDKEINFIDCIVKILNKIKS
jgi:DNA polymerase III delta prime subunit